MSNLATPSIGNGGHKLEPRISRKRRPANTDEVAPGVTHIAHRIVNTYLVSDAASGAFVLIDAGMPTSARKIIAAAEKRFGAGAKPAAIILTHGHFDHVGSLRKLIDHWRVPVYAHYLEMPFLTGRADYPPADPTVGGGLMAWTSGLLPRKGIDITDSLQLLPVDGTVPHLPEWRWVHTPGHAPGHISLLRDSDHTLIAGDAFVTVKQESLLAILTQLQEVHGPPAYFTIDWEAARRSVELLSAWGPAVAATGHGVPMSGPQLTEQLVALAADFVERAVPDRGRYVGHPVVTNDSGVLSIPPAIPSQWPKVAGVSLACIALAAAIHAVRRHRRIP